MTENITLKFAMGMSVNRQTGLEERGSARYMSSPRFYKANGGARLDARNREFEYFIAIYKPIIEERYIYTFDYQENESWTVYEPEGDYDSFWREDHMFLSDVYFRICIRRIDGADFSEGDLDEANRAFILNNPVSVTPVKTRIIDEAERASDRARHFRAADSLVIALLADTHYVVNGTWPDTAESLRQTHKLTGFRAIIHLGDLTDGMVTAEVTEEYARLQIEELNSIAPLYLTPGNHDANYFRGNSDVFSPEKQCEVYSLPAPSYYTDFADNRLRFIFLHSYDPMETERYGFREEDVAWLKKALDSVPAGWKVIVFSHIPPLAELQYWSKTIRSGEKVSALLDGYKNILAYIHGHNHTDTVYTGLSFPVIGVGCAKIEYFEAYKPPGARTAKRALNSRTQELWDILVITGDRLDFIRYGAGEDRHIQQR
ncbi:MAG: metallophosphoesterase [Clostridiales bacterium]|jgi:predicted phosphodiesterase|nr:metallophosphoesterase [Clostridiales bacterium]